MKSDYNKSMLRLGAVVVASASLFGAASTMNAAPVASPVYAAEDDTEAAEPTIQEENQTAYENDYLKIQALQEKLTEAINMVKENYPEFYESTGASRFTEIGKKLDQMLVDCETALDLANGNNEGYVSPLTDTEEQTLDSDIDEVAYDADQDRIAKNDKAYGDYMTELSLLQQELSTECGDDQEYSKFLNRGKVEAVYNELENLANDAEKYYEGVKEAGWFDLSITDDASAIRGQIASIVEAAQKAYEMDRREKNAEAYGTYMQTLSDLQEQLTAVVNDPELGPFVNRGMAESIYNELENLHNDAEKYYQGVEEAGWFDLSIADDKAALEGAIETLKENAEKAYEENQKILESERQQKNIEAYDKVMGQISDLRDKFNEAIAEDNDYYPYINRGTKGEIESAIDDLVEEADLEREKTLDEGEFGLNIDDSVVAIEGLINNMVEKAAQAYDKVRKANNEVNYNKCMEAIDGLRDKLAEATAEDNDYAKFLNRGKVESIESAIGELEDDVNAEKRATEEAGVFSLTIDDSVEAIEDMINKVVESAQQALEKERVDHNAEMYANCINQLVAFQEELSAQCGDETLDYYPYLNRGQVESLYNEAQNLYDEVEREYMATEEAGEFSMNIDDEITMFRGQLAKIVEAAQQAYEKVRVENNAAAYDAVMAQIQDLKDKLADVTNEENDFHSKLNRGLAESIEGEIEALEDDANAEKRATEEAGVFSLNIDDSVIQIEAAIEKLRNTAAEAYENERVENNAVAYGNYMKKINELLSAWDDAFADTTTEYYIYLNRGVVESIYNEIDLLKTDAEKYYQGVLEAGVFDLNIDNDYTMIMGEINAAVAKAEQAYETWRVAYNDEAYGTYMQTLSDLQDELTSQCANESLDYYPFINRGKVEAIYNELETMHDEAEKYYEGVKEAGVFDLSITDDAAMIRGQIKAIVDAAKKIVADPSIYNDEAYGKDITKLSEMQQEYTALWEEMQKTSPEFYESAYGQAMAQNVYGILNDMHDAVEAAYAAVEDGGYYVSPITEAFEQDFEEAVANLQNMAQAFADNYDAMMADNEAVDALDNEVFELGDKLDALDPEWMENEEAAALGDEIRALIDGLRSEIEGAYASSMKTGEYISPIDEADFAEVRTAMDNLYNLVKANVEGNRVDYNNAAFGAEFSLLVSLQEQLSNVWNTLVDEYYGFEEYGAAIALRTNLYDELQAKSDATWAEYEAVEEEGIYSPQLPYNFEQDILDGIEQLQALGEQYGVAWNEFQANGNTLMELMDQMRQYEAQLDEEVPGWDENADALDLDGEIWEALNGYFNDNNAAWQAFSKTGEYICPFDEEDITALIVKMDDLYRIALETSVSTLDAIDAEAEYYTLDGQKLSRPVRGMVNIVRNGDKVQKIFIK